MTLATKSNEVYELISGFVISVEFSKWPDVMDINRAFRFWWLFLTANLACIAIAFKSKLSLLRPISSAIIFWSCLFNSSRVGHPTGLRAMALSFSGAAKKGLTASGAYTRLLSKEFWFRVCTNGAISALNTTIVVWAFRKAYEIASARATFICGEFVFRFVEGTIWAMRSSKRGFIEVVISAFNADASIKFHSVSLSLYHRWLSAGGVISRFLGATLADAYIIPQAAHNG